MVATLVIGRLCERSSELHVAEQWYRTTALEDLLQVAAESVYDGRVEDWRAGVGRSLCSLLTRPFVCECHSISTMPRFQPPPHRT